MCNAVLLTIHAVKKNTQCWKKNKNRNKLDIDPSVENFKQEQNTHQEEGKKKYDVPCLTSQDHNQPYGICDRK